MGLVGLRGNMVKLFVFILALALISGLGSADLTLTTNIIGHDHISIENDVGAVSETVGGQGNYSYKEISSQSGDQTYQSEFNLNSSNPSWTNQYAISANNPDVGIGQSVSTSSMKYITAKTQIGSNSGLLRTDLQISGQGDLHSWLTKTATTATATSSGTINIKQHPEWLSEGVLNGNFSFHQGLSATPDPVEVQGQEIGNWLEGNGAVSVNPNGTVNQPQATDVIESPSNILANVTPCPAKTVQVIPISTPAQANVTVLPVTVADTPQAKYPLATAQYAKAGINIPTEAYFDHFLEGNTSGGYLNNFDAAWKLNFISTISMVTEIPAVKTYKQQADYYNQARDGVGLVTVTRTFEGYVPNDDDPNRYAEYNSTVGQRKNVYTVQYVNEDPKTWGSSGAYSTPIKTYNLTEAWIDYRALLEPHLADMETYLEQNSATTSVAA